METSVLICASTEDGTREDQIPGSIIGTCILCAVSIYIAPSGQRLLEEREDVRGPLCIRCGLMSILLKKNAGGKMEFGMAEGAAEELANLREEKDGL